MSGMPSSEWLGIERAENTVFAQRRHGNEDVTNWLSFLNASQVVLSYAQDLTVAESAELFQIERATAVIAASRILDSAAESLTRAGKPADDGHALAISYSALAATGYSTTGNFPAAETVLMRMSPWWPQSNPVLTALMMVSAPRLLGDLYPLIGNSTPASAFADALARFLDGNDPDGANVLTRFDALVPLLQEAFDYSLWLSARVVLHQLIALSAAELFRKSLPPQIQDILGKVVNAGFKVLLPPQYYALKESSLLKDKGNALICLPTSTGKTLLAELCLFAHTAHGNIGFYVVPYVALGRQVADKIQEHLAPGWKLLRLFGGYSESIDLPSRNSKCIAVVTPERLDSVLRNAPQLLQRTSCVVIDEAHTVASGDRGARLEGIIARLLIQQSRGTELKLVLLSAVVPNADLLREWIHAPVENMVRSSWTPSPKRIGIWSRAGQLEWFHGNDPLRPPAAEPWQKVTAIQLPWPKTVSPGDTFAHQSITAPANHGNIAYLLHYLHQQFEAPVLCVCPTKDMTRKIAAACTQRFPPLEPISAQIARAIDLIKKEHPQLTHLSRALSHGIAFHNASVPHNLRSLIEDAAKALELRVVVSTTTLAEGVDLPFRATVLADWLTYGDDGQTPFSSLLVRNIAGRAGRAGYFTEGDLILYDNPVGALAYKGQDKQKHLRTMLFSEGDTGLLSPIAAAPANVGVRGVLASQFLAAVDENAQSPDLETLFFSNLLAARQENRDESWASVLQAAGSFLDPSWQLATRNSPLQITELGRAVSKSGFSPTSALTIRNALVAPALPAEPVSLVSYLLESLGNLPEQQNRKFAKLLKAHRERAATGKGKKGRPPLCVRIEDLPVIVADWLAGKKPLEVFKNLPANLRSTRTPPMAKWLAGLDEPTSWDEEFENFCDFQRDTLQLFMPWLLRACEMLTPFLPSAPVFDDWKQLAETMEHEDRVQDTTSFKGFIRDLKGMSKEALAHAIDNKLADAVFVLVDMGNSPEEMAGSNATGFHVDEYEVEQIDFTSEECRVSLNWHATGDQDDDKPFTGTTLRGTAVAVINDLGEVEFEDVSCELVYDDDGLDES